MPLHKTDKARAALQAHSRGLSVLDRRILILSDGHRRLDEIATLLGAGARDAAQRLVEQQYLSAAQAWRDPVPRLDPPPRAAAAPTPPAAEPSPAPAPAAAGPRRSLVAAKMYMLDMLQLQRGPEPAALRATLQASAGREALVSDVLRGLAYIQRVSPASYGERVHARVAEVLPEDALPALEASCGSPALAATG